MQLASAEHESALPDHLSPMPMPETRSEARLLVFFLNSGCFPTYERDSNKRGPDRGEPVKQGPESTREQEPEGPCDHELEPREVGLGPAEAELKGRGTRP